MVEGRGFNPDGLGSIFPEEGSEGQTHYTSNSESLGLKDQIQIKPGQDSRVYAHRLQSLPLW